MSTQVNVIATPVVSFGKLSFNFKPQPSDQKANALLAGLKKQFKYKASERGGKTLPERVTFDNEWIKFAQNTLDVEFIVTDVPSIVAPIIGQPLPSDKPSAAVDFSFLE